jgi:hypothetical protein
VVTVVEEQQRPTRDTRACFHPTRLLRAQGPCRPVGAAWPLRAAESLPEWSAPRPSVSPSGATSQWRTRTRAGSCRAHAWRRSGSVGWFVPAPWPFAVAIVAHHIPHHKEKRRDDDAIAGDTWRIARPQMAPGAPTRSRFLRDAWRLTTRDTGICRRHMAHRNPTRIATPRSRARLVSPFRTPDDTDHRSSREPSGALVSEWPRRPRGPDTPMAEGEFATSPHRIRPARRPNAR